MRNKNKGGLHNDTEKYIRLRKGSSQLKKDTGIDLLSFDWSEPMLETENSCVYFLTWDKEKGEYIVEPGARQAEDCEEIIRKSKIKE